MKRLTSCGGGCLGWWRDARVRFAAGSWIVNHFSLLELRKLTCRAIVIGLVLWTGLGHATSWGQSIVEEEQQQQQDDRPAQQVQAATADALRKLQDQVLAVRVTRSLTVEEFVNRTESRQELLQTLQRAEQIGGPRWLDEQTCQVQLEISGPRVAQALTQIAASKSRQSPVPAEVLAQTLASWKDRTFAATGTSTSAERIEAVCPAPDADAWTKVNDESRRAALAAAREDAVRRSVEGIRPLAIDERHTVGDVLKVRSIEDRTRSWFASRPVTRVEFGEDLEVQLTLSAPPEELADGLRDALGEQDEVKVELDEQGWERFEAALVEKMPRPVGRARAVAAADAPAPSTTAATVTTTTTPATMTTASVSPVAIPPFAPAWVNDQLDAAGSATSARSKLRAARIAESEAVQNLAAKVGALALHDNLTLAAAAERDPRIKQALDQSLARAQVYKTEYGADSSATVHVTLDLRDVWEALRQVR